MPCLTCGIPTKGAPFCATHEALDARRRQKGRVRPTTTQRGYDEAWNRLKDQVLLEEGHTCHWCGDVATTGDHIVPIRLAPELRLVRSNVVAASRACNSGHKVG